jgi:hypothetical protein
MKETAGPVLAKINIIRKKSRFNFKIGRIGEAYVFTSYSPNLRNFIDERGSYYHAWAEA